MKRIFLLFLPLILLPSKVKSQDDFYLLRSQDRKIVTMKTAVQDLKKAKIIFVGEIHSIKRHHELQLTLIDELKRQNVDIAIAMEMFSEENQGVLDDWVSGKIALEDFIKKYSDNWRAPWFLYGEIFMYAQKHKIPIIGINIPKEISEKVAAKGFFSLSKKDLERLPPDVRCDVDDNYKTFIKKIFDMHGKREKDLDYFCEAQVLWDKSMAYYVTNYLKRSPNKTIVVLTGVVHSWKNAAPKQVAKFNENISYKVVLPQINGKLEPETVTTKDTDYMVYED